MANSTVPLKSAKGDLASLLIRYDLSFCYLLELYCTHGIVRVATATLPTDGQVRCPRCRALKFFRLVGMGGTRRVLPFHEQMPVIGVGYKTPRLGGGQ